MTDAKEPEPNETEPVKKQDDIHPNVDAFLQMLARWTAEDILKKVGGKNE